MSRSLDNWIAEATQRGVDTSKRLKIDDEPWVDAASAYGGRHFIRILVGDIGGELSIRVEAGIGGSDSPEGHFLETFPAAPDGLTWDVTQSESIVAGLLKGPEESWITDLALGCDEMLSRLAESSTKLSKATAHATNRFDSIGGATSAPMSPSLPGALDPLSSVFSFQVQRHETQQIRCDLRFSGPIEQIQLDSLQRLVQRTLRAKFDIALVASSDHFPSRKWTPDSVHFSFLFRANPVESQASPIEETVTQIDVYLEELASLNRAGVNLYAFFGLTTDRIDVPRPEQTIREQTRQEAGAFELSFDEEESSDGEIFLDDAVNGPLRPGHFADPRLRVPDCDHGLVDVVLRHPGYSDRRIGQVLSILFSISYLDASDIVERAPCVIGWSLGLQEARRIKGLVEPTGAKVVLVPPDRFPAP